MSKQLSAEERFRLLQTIYSAVNHSDNEKRKTVTQAYREVGLASLDTEPSWEAMESRSRLK